MNQIAEIQSTEPEGVFLRKAWLVARTPEAMLEILDRVKELEADTGWETPELLPRLLNMNTYTIKVDDIGILYLHFLEPRVAQVHIFFWDRRLRGREGLCRELAIKALDVFQLDTLWTAVPLRYSRMKGFVERVGFRFTTLRGTIQTFAFSRSFLHDANSRSAT